jgi:hypothetical protein
MKEFLFDLFKKLEVTKISHNVLIIYIELHSARVSTKYHVVFLMKLRSIKI